MVFVEPGDIAELIETGQFEEGVELEAKRAGGGIPRNAWETISAFANTLGGVLILGLDETADGWRVEGVADPERRVQELQSHMRDQF
ncbi:MAG: ATP-binding protein [Chloroflexota bacterium]|nr:ATP-binding protein [Chloroflexota bacterium]